MAEIEIVMEVSGLDKLEQTLVAGGKKASVNFLRKIEKKVAQVPLAAMRETVPVAEKAYRRGDHKGGSTWIEPGTLQASLRISSESIKSQNEVVVHIGPASSESFVGRFLEFGTEKMPARHWMDAAWQASRSGLLDAYQEITTELLTDIAAEAK